MPDLYYISLRENPLTGTINLSGNFNLKYVYLYYMPELSSINIQNTNNVNILSFYTINNPNLTCIVVDDYVSANKGESIYARWRIDSEVVYTHTDNCESQTAISDGNFEQALINLGYDRVLDNQIPTDNINIVEDLNIDNENIEDLSGIEDFTALSVFSVIGNNVTSIDLSNNENLSSVDVSKMTTLSFLDMRNSNNTNISYFNATDNPNLTCIYVDDANYCTTNWSNIDDTSHFVETEEECESLGVEEVIKADLEVFPNPVTGILRIVGNKITIKTIDISNLTGQKINTLNYTSLIDLSNYPSGIYFIKITTDKDETATYKIIKE